MAEHFQNGFGIHAVLREVYGDRMTQFLLGDELFYHHTHHTPSLLPQIHALSTGFYLNLLWFYLTAYNWMDILYSL
jgi:hypothetical protein